MKKSLFFNVLLSVAISIILYFLFKSQESNDRLIRQIELKDSLSKKTKKRDSVFAKKTEEYAKVITKYVSDCNFTIGDKTITTAEVVKMTNKAMHEVDVLSDSLTYMKKLKEEYKKAYENNIKIHEEIKKQNNSNSDSSFIYKHLLDQVAKMYGIKYSYARDGNKFSFEVNRNKRIDSALILLPYYRHTLLLDSAKGEWSIITDSERNIRRAKKLQQKN